MQETAADPGSFKSSSELELSSDDAIMREVKDYAKTGVAKIIIRPQCTGGDPPPAAHLARTRSSIGVGSSTNGEQVSTNSSRYVCRDWVSQVAIKRLKYIALQFRLTREVHHPRPDERPHLPPRGLMAFSESILRGGVALPLHSFVEVVLQHFIVATFQFTPNSFRIIVAFFITFMEAGIGKPNVDKFTYVYEIKALAKHEGFWYTTKWGTTTKGIIGLRDNIGHWKDHFFFYPSKRPGEFRTACE